MAISPEEMTRTALRDHGKSVVCVVIHKNPGMSRRDNETLAGSGFIVREAGGDTRALVMTANHVAAFYDADDEDEKLRIRLPESDQEFEGEILHTDVFRDLALIAVSGMPDGYPALKFSNETNLPVGTPAVLLAYYQPENLAESENPILKKPGACPGKIVGPPVRNTTKQMDWSERVRHECASMSGCSGGPVMANGLVIGVNQYGDVQTARAASFVTVEAVVKEWAKYPEDGADITLENLFKLLDLN